MPQSIQRPQLFQHTRLSPGSLAQPLARLKLADVSLQCTPSPRTTACKANSDARLPYSGNHFLGSKATPNASLVLSDTLASLLSTDTFRGITDRCPAQLLILNNKNMLEIICLASLSTEGFVANTQSTDAATQPQSDASQLTQIFINTGDAKSEIQLSKAELLLLAQVIQETRICADSDAKNTLKKIALAPPTADFTEILKYMIMKFDNMSDAAANGIQQQLDQVSTPLALDLTQEANNAQEQLLDFVLKNPNTQRMQLLVNHICQKLKKSENTTAQAFIFSQSGFDTINILSTIAEDLYLREAHQFSAQCFLNTPLSEPEKYELYKKIIGKITSNILLTLQSQHHANLSSDNTIASQIHTAQKFASPLAKQTDHFQVFISPDGIPWAETDIDPNLDQLEPFFSNLFEDPRNFDLTLIVEAKTFSNSDYPRVPLHNELRLFARETLTRHFNQSAELKFIGSMGYLFNWCIEKSLARQEISPDQAEILTTHVHDYISHCLAEELSIIDFFEDQPTIMKEAGFAQKLYEGAFKAIAAGEIRMDTQLHQSFNTLLAKLSHKILAERLA